MTLQTLAVAVVPWPAVGLDGTPGAWRLWDFLVDGRPLAERLGLARGGLDLCGSPLQWADRRRRLPLLAAYGRQLTGAAPGENQFGTGRVVLYGCHCGCDYCGVVSARVEREGGVVRWCDVGWEDEGGPRGTATFAFATRQLAAAVAGFLRRAAARHRTRRP